VADELIARGAAVPFSVDKVPEFGTLGLFRGEMENTVARIRELVEIDRDA
jgi:hypothetical protein